MPRTGLTKQAENRNKKRKLASDKEGKIQEALQALNGGIFDNISKAMRHFGVSRNTLFWRYKRLNGPPSKAQIKKQLLTEAQEKTLCEWIVHMGEMGQPISKQALRAKVADLSEIIREKTRKTGQQHLPSKSWVYGFLERNTGLALRRPTGLDAVRARNFNTAVVGRHFQLLGDLLKENDIPLKNMYNMDEKGIQLGGGRKLDGTRYFFSQDQQDHVKTQGTSLELITIIECVAADGSNLKPALVFSRKNVLHEGYFKEDSVL